MQVIVWHHKSSEHVLLCLFLHSALHDQFHTWQPSIWPLFPITSWRQNENNSLTWCPHVYSTKCKSASKLTNVEHVMNMYTFSGVCFAKKGFSSLFLYSLVFRDQWRYQLWLRPLWLCLSCRSLSLGIYVIRSTLYGFKFSYNQPIIAIFKLCFTEYLSCIIQNY